MRVMFVLTAWHRGGAERHTLDLARALALRGHACRLVSIKPMLAEGLAPEPSPNCSFASCDAQGYIDRAAIGRLVAEMDGFAPDVLLCATPYALMYGAMARRSSTRPALPLVAVLHTTKLQTRKDGLQYLLYRPLLARSQALVYVCGHQRRHWERNGLHARRPEVIYNGVDVTRYAPFDPSVRTATRSAYGLAADDLVIGITAAFRPEKNHVFLVQALKRLRDAGAPAKLLMVGDGGTREAVRQRAESLGVASHAVFAGAHADVRPLVAAFDVFVLPSTAIETFALSALEAMAMGVPAVLSDIGGATEMVEAGVNGGIFAPGDLPGFLDALAPLHDAAVRARMGAAARAVVLQRFTHGAMVDAYERLFGSLLA